MIRVTSAIEAIRKACDGRKPVDERIQGAHWTAAYAEISSADLLQVCDALPACILATTLGGALPDVERHPTVNVKVANLLALLDEADLIKPPIAEASPKPPPAKSKEAATPKEKS